MVARQAHDLEVGGSNPSPAPNPFSGKGLLCAPRICALIHSTIMSWKRDRPVWVCAKGKDERAPTSHCGYLREREDLPVGPPPEVHGDGCGKTLCREKATPGEYGTEGCADAAA